MGGGFSWPHKRSLAAITFRGEQGSRLGGYRGRGGRIEGTLWQRRLRPAGVGWTDPPLRRMAGPPIGLAGGVSRPSGAAGQGRGPGSRARCGTPELAALNPYPPKVGPDRKRHASTPPPQKKHWGTWIPTRALDGSCPERVTRQTWSAPHRCIQTRRGEGHSPLQKKGFSPIFSPLSHSRGVKQCNTQRRRIFFKYLKMELLQKKIAPWAASGPPQPLGVGPGTAWYGLNTPSTAHKPLG